MSVRKRPLRETQPWPGADSEFYLLERKLQRNGLARQESETSFEWAARVAAEAPPIAPLLNGALGLHHRYRFDPAGITNDERQRLRELVRSCASQL